jgi:hypothetical protein
MKTKLILCLALFVFNLPAVLRADYSFFESVEWLTSYADQIGVYHAEKVYGPDVTTNTAQAWNCCFCTADFKLTKKLRGNPPVTFSRTMQVTKLDFHAGEDAVFFFAAGEQLRKIDLHDEPNYHDFFSQWDYIRLERPQGLVIDGMAFDHTGRVLTNRSEILALVETSLKLPRASPGIVAQTYYLGDETNYNFHAVSLLDFRFSGEASLVQQLITMNPILIIPKCLYQDDSSTTNKLAKPATNP